MPQAGGQSKRQLTGGQGPCYAPSSKGRVMENHTDAGKPAVSAMPQGTQSLKDQKLAVALRRNLARRKASVRGAETGADS